MIQRHCLCCHEKFIPRRNIPNQHYCSRKGCQKARKANWQQKKIKSDPDYRENQTKAQKRWREMHPDYMRTYRQTHREYRERERKRQANNRFLGKGRPGKIDEPLSMGSVVKMDASYTQPFEKSGYYRISPFSEDGVVKMDAYIVQLTVVGRDTVCTASS